VPTLSEIEDLFKERREPDMISVDRDGPAFQVDPVTGTITASPPRDEVAIARAEKQVADLLLQQTQQQLTVANRELERLKRAVHNKAQEVYESRDSICLDGTNEWLNSLGIDPLTVRTKYKFLVPVTIELVIEADSEERAREILNSDYDNFGPNSDSEDVEYCGMERVGEHAKYDWFKTIDIAESWAVEDY
jgi:hypothetical protein